MPRSLEGGQIYRRIGGWIGDGNACAGHSFTNRVHHVYTKGYSSGRSLKSGGSIVRDKLHESVCSPSVISNAHLYPLIIRHYPISISGLKSILGIVHVFNVCAGYEIQPIVRRCRVLRDIPWRNSPYGPNGVV